MSNRILCYRGLLACGGQETILLSTKKGEVGYRITKFQLMPQKPGTTDYVQPSHPLIHVSSYILFI